jgi:hypothetical protein
VGVGQSFRELLEVLLRHDVDFLIVGATAAVLEGAPMTTFDLDIVFEPSPENRPRLLGALIDIDAVYLDPLRRGIRPTEERLAAHRLSLFETRLGRLDVMTSIAPGWGWNELVPRSHRLEAAGGTLRVLDLEAVIESKQATDREKDRAALPLLREVLRQRGKRSR